MSTLGTKEKINVGLEMCLFSETEIFTLWINSLQLETHVKCLGFSLGFGFFFLYSYNSGHFCFNGLFWSACARELEANYHMLQICSCNAKFMIQVCCFPFFGMQRFCCSSLNTSKVIF